MHTAFHSTSRPFPLHFTPESVSLFHRPLFCLIECSSCVQARRSALAPNQFCFINTPHLCNPHRPSFFSSACLLAFLPACSPSYLPACIHPSLSFSLPACLTVCLPSYPCACLPAACLPTCLPPYLPTCMPAGVPACPRVTQAEARTG